MPRNPRVPLVTLVVVVLCCSLYFVGTKRVGTKHKHVCLKAHGIIRAAEVYRVFTHVLFHKGPWHLAVTMIPMLILGTIIEKSIGSILMLFLIIIFWLMSSILEVAMATMLYHIAHGLFHGCSLGFSGIVFGFLVLFPKYINFKENGRSMWKVMCNLLPWICLFVYYVVFHRGSVFMHLGGIIAGYAYKCGLLDIIFPSPERLAEWENSSWLSCLAKLPCYAHYSQPGLPMRNPIVVNRDRFLQVVYTGSPPADL